MTQTRFKLAGGIVERTTSSSSSSSVDTATAGRGLVKDFVNKKWSYCFIRLFLVLDDIGLNKRACVCPSALPSVSRSVRHDFTQASKDYPVNGERLISYVYERSASENQRL